MPSSRRSARSWPVPGRAWSLGTVAPLAIAVALVVVLALTGGSSRPDAVQLLVLRPAIVVLGTLLLMLPGGDWRQFRPLVLLLGAFAATIAIQLVPLPPVLWHAIPGHARFNAVLDAVGGGASWRPLTLSVDGTLNALVALIVPVVTLAAMAHLHTSMRAKALLAVFTVVAASMVLGLAQVASGPTSLLYFYEKDTNDQLVGLFANRNHQAAFIAMMLPLLRVWALAPGLDGLLRGRSRTIAAYSVGAFLIVYILVLGSRAGLVLALVGLLGAFFVKPRFSDPRSWPLKIWLTCAGVTVALIVLFAVVVLSDRSAAFDRFSAMQGLKAEGRVEVLPVLLRICADVWPFGTGFGSFVPVFQSYEPDAILTPSYWNNAHNDPLEVLISGGVPSILALVAFLMWWARASFGALMARGELRSESILARGAVFATLVLMLASTVDYPVRTPLLSAVFTILCCFLTSSAKRAGR
jgi:hypothetical protein